MRLRRNSLLHSLFDFYIESLDLLVERRKWDPELLRGLSQYLPQVIDQLTPHGRIPTGQEVQRML